MATRSPRSRSTTSASTSHRPISRQSTTSAQSNGSQAGTSQPQDSLSIFQAAALMPSEVWQQHQHHGIPQQTRPMQAAGNRYGVDSSLHHHSPVSFAPDSCFQHGPNAQMEPPSHFNDQDIKDNSGFGMSMEGSMAPDGAEDAAKRKKGSASSQANDNELRRLFRENEGRDLHDVALQVVRDEKGPKAEKTKQIFGMLWLSTHTKRSSSSVPRNRVFSSYATRCGTERVPPLNPASFGKLVRIIFPGITTRRLGVRGESKYHYVELSLIDDSRPERASVSRGRSMTVDLQREDMASNGESSRPQLPADTAYFSPTDSPKRPINLVKPNLTSAPLYQDWNNRNNAGVPTGPIMQRPLQFPNTTGDSEKGEAQPQLHLPSIEPYLPPGTDVDAVDSLTSVYRSHCLLAIDNFRFCKTDKMCDSYKSLVGLLTVPGQKLLAHPKILPWLRECDWMKYQMMIPMLNQIILNQVPRKAMAHMEHVGRSVRNWITQFFQNQPQHTQDAMLGPANIFVSLLERFLRVNRAALDVAQVLQTMEDRDQLWRDWVGYVQPLHVLQNSLLSHGHNRVLHILTQEVRFLLNPLDTDAMVQEDSLFESTGEQSDFQRSEMQRLANGGEPRVIIEQLQRFLKSLASRFPGVDARSLLSHIDVIGNNISRNLTLNGASSLGNWWRIKLFVDEMSYWLAEMGGFLESTPEVLDAMTSLSSIDYAPKGESGLVTGRIPTRPQASTAKRNSLLAGPSYGQSDDQEQSLTLVEDASARQTLHQSVSNKVQPKRGTQRSRSGSTVVDDDGMGAFGDDSGIAMGMDDDFGLDAKYNNFVQGVHGSDPADVVVC